MSDHLEIAQSGGLADASIGRTGHGMTILACALAAGIALGHIGGDETVWPWLVAAFLLLGAAAMAQFLSRRRAMTVLLVAAATLSLGAGWFNLRQHYASPNDLAAMIGDEAALVRVRGVALQSPVLRHRVGGPMAKFDYRQPSTYFPMRVDALLDRGGAVREVRGEVLVRIDESVPPFRAGDHVEAMGFLLRPGPPLNPGEFNFREYAKSLGQAGFLTVERRELLQVTPAARHSIHETILNWRDHLRRRASAWLLAELPPTSRTERDSLLAILMLGERDEQIDGVYPAFQRVGLAHLLAISGFHMGVLAGFVLMMARLMGGNRRWQGLTVILFVLIYLALVEARMPVLRAGLMTIAASLGLMSQRRLYVGGLCSLTAIALLLWRPDQLFQPGFQLTFGVVLGLIYLAPRVRRRMFGRRDHAPITSSAMLVQWLSTALAVALTSWLIALPIVMYHFGMISPLGIVLSVLTLPLASALLALGFVKMICAAILPSVGLVVGVPLSIIAEVLLAVVTTVDSIPGSVIPVRHPSAAWAIAALICAGWWLYSGRWTWRIRHFAVRKNRGPRFIDRFFGFGPAARWGCTIAAAGWFLWPAPGIGALRIDMLAVGDGSCYVIRSGESAVLFDAGSSTDLNVARRSLIPAMRRLGVTSIDAVVISHADLDHYSAVVDLAKEFGIGEALVSPHFQSAAQADLFGPAAFALGELVKQRVMVRTVVAGEVRHFGDAAWTWLHPPADRTFRRDNDSSMVIRIEAAGRRVLFCGDIQRDAMEELMRRDSGELRADVMELPHHGSFHDFAPRFVDRVGPAVVMQSTGWSRWSRDQWARELAETERLVTARDGACWVEFNLNGGMSVGRFINNDPISERQEY